MADYKDMIGRLWGQAKDLAETTGVRDVYEKGAQRAKNFGSAAKLTLDLNQDHKELERVFTEIGKLYYEQGNPEGLFAPLFEQAALLQSAIQAKEAEIEVYRSSFEAKTGSPADEIMDFESIVNQTEDEGRH